MAKKRKQVPLTEDLVRGIREPKAGISVLGRREPKIAEPVDLMHLKASWRVNKVQMVDPYGWHELGLEGIEEIRTKLAYFETMTWNEIFVKGNKRNHSIVVSDLRCPHAKRWLADNMPDQPELWTLRLSGIKRIWGIFSEGAYQVLFWDPLHKIMPTLK
jgi:hypothetical protein